MIKSVFELLKNKSTLVILLIIGVVVSVYAGKLIYDREKFGTVGAVALDDKGVVCVGTSTGGIGNETPGRVSDSASVAGTYADQVGGLSCTGKGEHIINQAVAAKVIYRLRDGVPLKKSSSI